MIDPLTYFGLWSGKDIHRVSGLLRDLGVRFEVTNDRVLDERRLRSWNAWDQTAEDPYAVFDLWIHNEDLSLVGNTIVDHFPERFL